MRKAAAILLLFLLGFALPNSVTAASDNLIQFTVKGVPFKMVKVEGGSTGTYYIGQTEVTQALWKAVMGNNPSKFRGDQNPVDSVSYLDCEAFIKKLNSLTGQQFRIPSKDEWIYAAQGGKLSRGYKFSGSDDMGTVGWYKENSGNRTHPVGLKKPNELGIYDMTGNVKEWTTEYEYSALGRFSPHRRGSRGADYHCMPFLSGVINYNCSSIDYCQSDQGLRLVLTKPTPGSYCVVNASSATTPQTKQTNQSDSNDNILTFTIKGVTFEMVKVEGGSFRMGSDSGESNEKPVHTETVKTFYIGKTEVTEALWHAVMGGDPTYIKSDKAVGGVSWNDCQEFISKLNKLTGKNFSLPTEAEWEYAARGGNRSRGCQYSGSNDINTVAWYTGNKATKLHAMPVARKAPNELGLYDMSGNVWEWCSDAFCNNYSSPRNSECRVLRGGGWQADAKMCRVAYRALGTVDNGVRVYGLRLVLH